MICARHMGAKKNNTKWRKNIIINVYIEKWRILEGKAEDRRVSSSTQKEKEKRSRIKRDIKRGTKHQQLRRPVSGEKRL